MEWMPIERLTDKDNQRMILAISNKVIAGRYVMKGQVTDPYCVWRQSDGSFARWPHKFPPTHYCDIPERP